jgi:hypothetical protein
MNKKMDNDDKINLIIAYENDELSEEKTINLFSALIKSGECWGLQGHYGRMANALIENEIINKDGIILI